jgi:hypothetical protein
MGHHERFDLFDRLDLGVSSTAPTWRDASVALWVLSGIYLVLQALIGFGCGGYLAGRCRLPYDAGISDETENRDGLHGVASWALAVVLGAALAALIAAGASRPTNLTQPATTTEPSLLSTEIDHLFRAARRPPNADVIPLRAEAGRVLLTSSSHSGVSSDDRPGWCSSSRQRPASPGRMPSAASTASSPSPGLRSRAPAPARSSSRSRSQPRCCLEPPRPGLAPRPADAIVTARRSPIGWFTPIASTGETSGGEIRRHCHDELICCPPGGAVDCFSFRSIAARARRTAMPIRRVLACPPHDYFPEAGTGRNRTARRHYRHRQVVSYFGRSHNAETWLKRTHSWRVSDTRLDDGCGTSVLSSSSSGGD